MADPLRGVLGNLRLAERIDPGRMPPRALDELIRRNPPIGPIATATWFGRQGAIISAWSLWEFYSESLCLSLSNQIKRNRKDSHVTWIGQALAATDR